MALKSIFFAHWYMYFVYLTSRKGTYFDVLLVRWSGRGNLKPPPPPTLHPLENSIINKPLTITLSNYNPSEIFLDPCMWNLFGLNKRLRIFTCVAFGAHAGISKSKRFNIFFLHDRTTFIVTWFKIWGKIIFACYV